VDAGTLGVRAGGRWRVECGKAMAVCSGAVAGHPSTLGDVAKSPSLYAKYLRVLSSAAGAKSSSSTAYLAIILSSTDRTLSAAARSSGSWSRARASSKVCCATRCASLDHFVVEAQLGEHELSRSAGHPKTRRMRQSRRWLRLRVPADRGSIRTLTTK